MKLNDVRTQMLVPRFMEEDRTVIGMCAAFDYLLSRSLEKMKLVNLFENLEILEEEVLDYIAKKEKIEWYDTSFSKKQKINIIRNAERNCMFVGTASSVERVVQDLMGIGSVVEWYEYSGEPYHFKIKTDAEIGDDINKLIAKLVKSVKRTRTILDTVEIEKSIKTEQNIGTLSFQCIKPEAIIDGFNVEAKNIQEDKYARTLLHQCIKPEDIIDGFNVEAELIKEKYNAGIAASSQYLNTTIIE